VKAHGKTKEALEAIGADPNVDDTEGTASEDRWFGRGRHGWWDGILQRFGKS
jgi:hypothetical protein